jgi:Zn finger protein HypA/HybF involved in hydrogenase expression
MSYTDEDFEKVFDAVLEMNLHNEDPDEIDLGISINVVKIKLTCSECGEIIMEDGFEKTGNSEIVPCHRDRVRIDGVWCDDCGSDEVDIDLEIELIVD